MSLKPRLTVLNTSVETKARLVLRELLGQIRLEPEADGSLWAAYKIQPAVIVRAAVTGLAG